MNLKKIVAAGVAAVCAVSMAACGGSNLSLIHISEPTRPY